MHMEMELAITVLAAFYSAVSPTAGLLRPMVGTVVTYRSYNHLIGEAEENLRPENL
jgi:hypothetical protein